MSDAAPGDHCRTRSLVYGIVTYLVCAATLVVFRLHAFALPLENDECNYAYVAQRLLDGDRLYTDVWDHQPPGVFALFAVVTRLFGGSDADYRWTAIVFSLASMALIQLVVRRDFGNAASVVAAGVFAAISTDPGTSGDGCNREIYMNAMTLASFALITTGRPSIRNHMLGGVLLGLASTFKTVVAAQWLLLTIWAALNRLAEKRRMQDSVIAVAAMVVGPILIWMGIAAYFAATNRFSSFVDAVFLYNLSYSGGGGGWISRFPAFFNPVFNVFTSGIPLWLAAAFALPGLVILKRSKLGASMDGAIVAYAVGSFLAVCLPGKFWPHYYHLLFPAAILVCVAVTAGLIRSFKSAAARRAGFALCLAWAIFAVVQQLRHYLLLPPDRIATPHPVYRYRQNWAKSQGQRLAQLTDPHDTVFVWGQDAGIYRYSGRRCASRYTMVGALIDQSTGMGARQDALIEDLKKNRPRLVLIVEPEFDALRSWLQSNYIMAGLRAADHHDDNPGEIIMVALMDPTRPVQSIDWEWPPRRQPLGPQ